MVGPVHRGRGRALRQPPALDDQDVERVEELADLLGERRSARDAKPQAASEAVLDLAVHQSVGEAVPERKPGRKRLAALAEGARLPARAESPVQQAPPRAARLLE